MVMSHKSDSALVISIFFHPSSCTGSNSPAWQHTWQYACMCSCVRSTMHVNAPGHQCEPCSMVTNGLCPRTSACMMCSAHSWSHTQVVEPSRTRASYFRISCTTTSAKLHSSLQFSASNCRRLRSMIHLCAKLSVSLHIRQTVITTTAVLTARHGTCNYGSMGAVRSQEHYAEPT